MQQRRHRLVIVLSFWILGASALSAQSATRIVVPPGIRPPATRQTAELLNGDDLVHHNSDSVAIITRDTIHMWGDLFRSAAHRTLPIPHALRPATGPLTNQRVEWTIGDAVWLSATSEVVVVQGLPEAPQISSLGPSGGLEWQPVVLSQDRIILGYDLSVSGMTRILWVDRAGGTLRLQALTIPSPCNNAIDCSVTLGRIDDDAALCIARPGPPNQPSLGWPTPYVLSELGTNNPRFAPLPIPSILTIPNPMDPASLVPQLQVVTGGDGSVGLYRPGWYPEDIWYYPHAAALPNDVRILRVWGNPQATRTAIFSSFSNPFNPGIEASRRGLVFKLSDSCDALCYFCDRYVIEPLRSGTRPTTNPTTTTVREIHGNSYGYDSISEIEPDHIISYFRSGGSPFVPISFLDQNSIAGNSTAYVINGDVVSYPVATVTNPGRAWAATAVASPGGGPNRTWITSIENPFNNPQTSVLAIDDLAIFRLLPLSGGRTLAFATRFPVLGMSSPPQLEELILLTHGGLDLIDPQRPFLCNVAVTGVQAYSVPENPAPGQAFDLLTLFGQTYDSRFTLALSSRLADDPLLLSGITTCMPPPFLLDLSDLVLIPLSTTPAAGVASFRLSNPTAAAPELRGQTFYLQILMEEGITSGSPEWSAGRTWLLTFE